jgi:hypothetical protein
MIQQFTNNSKIIYKKIHQSPFLIICIQYICFGIFHYYLFFNFIFLVASHLSFSTSALFLCTMSSIFFMDSSHPDNQIGGIAVSSCGFLGVITCPLNSFRDFESMDRQVVCDASAFFPLVSNNFCHKILFSIKIVSWWITLNFIVSDIIHKKVIT